MKPKIIQPTCGCRILETPEDVLWERQLAEETLEVPCRWEATFHFDPACEVPEHQGCEEWPCGVKDCRDPRCPAAQIQEFRPSSEGDFPVARKTPETGKSTCGCSPEAHRFPSNCPETDDDYEPCQPCQPKPHNVSVGIPPAAKAVLKFEPSELTELMDLFTRIGVPHSLRAKNLEFELSEAGQRYEANHWAKDVDPLGYVLSVSQAHLHFSLDGKYEGVLVDEMYFFVPRVAG